MIATTFLQNTMKDLKFVELIYLFGAFQGIFLSSAILLRARNKANTLLSLLIGLFSFYLIEQAIFLSGDITSFPHLIFATLPLSFLVGPLFYHFIRLNTLENQKFKIIHIIHILPFLYEVIILSPFYLLSARQKLAVYNFKLDAPDSPFAFDQFWLGYMIYLVSTTWFMILAFRLLKRSNGSKGAEVRKRLVLRWISFLFISYLAGNFLVSIFSIVGIGDMSQWQHVSLIILTIFVLLIGYICVLDPKLIIHLEQPEKYINSSLSKEQIEHYKYAIIQCTKEDELYLKDDLTPNMIAEKINVSSSDLSRIFSEGLNTNFYRFVNEYRIQHAKKLLATGRYANAKMIHIAFDSGFSNKSSFLRNFKEITGMTPSAYKSSSTKVSESLDH